MRRTSPKKPVAHCNRRDDAGKIGDQRAAERVADAADADGAVVHGNHVERGFGAALHGRGRQGREAVHAVILHRLDQHAARGGTGEWLDQRGRQRIDKTRIQMRGLRQPANAAAPNTESSTSALRPPVALLNRILSWPGQLLGNVRA